MTARISPRYIRIDTSLRLTTPPKRSVMCSMSKTTSLVAVCDSTTAVLMRRPCLVRMRSSASSHRTSDVTGDDDRLRARRLFEVVGGEFDPPAPGGQQPRRTEDHHEEDHCAD